MNIENKIGVFGGTFDPIHYGHLLTAEILREKYELDTVIFVPWGNPPKKWKSNVTNAEHRYNMVSISIETNPRFQVSRTEIDRVGHSYTIDTIDELNDIYKDAKFYFITGPENISKITEWKEVDRLFKKCEFITMQRLGYYDSTFREYVDYLKKEYCAIIHMANTPIIQISSTEIREKVKNNQSIKYLLPERVEKYIQEHGLYSK